jgi:hypothetical protein
MAGSQGRGVDRKVILPLPRSREGNESLNEATGRHDREGRRVGEMLVKTP